MADDIDRAQAINEALQADAMRDWRLRQPTGPGRSECEECGETIPEKRRQAVPGCRLCIDCQRALEAARRRI
ncbi:MAG: TraR/DksA C4-type zinc finger protein [Syntrophotalea acetylenica]|uniref:TraR/DksA C4-type zinc finger protein n=1 Tax=Syntrophotalea acetylenica TaxID=29542 RepID=UPI002A3647C9|nr:TraR/DksA C4-type zinc finger protein [Syntrophotalea acetylenica]MDD4457867.1 TraR/DksA C4-type zinc finger protein [Syntrophotalea acetylenica]MDY0261993.1 TraR/DksA C4-type zinc finger protein [Syntrophotalea acetylenica]